MTWILLSLLAAFLQSGVNILDKAVVGNEFKDPILAGVVSGFTLFGVFGIAGIITHSIVQDPTLMIIGVIAGVLYGLDTVLYYQVLKRAEVTRFIPTLSLHVILVAIMGFLLFGEHFTLPTYIGIGVLIVGTLLLARKVQHEKLKITLAAVLTAVMIIAVTARILLIKVGTSMASYWAVLFWFGIGSGILATILYVMHHPHLQRQEARGVKHLIFIDLTSSSTVFVVALALATGPASLVAALLSTKHFLTYGAAVVLGKYHPNFLQESLTKNTIIKKGLATLLIIAGVILIVSTH